LPLKPTKLLLRNSLCPGDIVMLTAAVRDLHHHYPGRFLTDVRTPHPALWENNPHLTPLKARDPSVKSIRCHYPLINRSNETPSHCLHGFIEFLNDQLKLNIRPTVFKGDLHLSDLEKSWYSQVQELTGADTPFWIIVAGGKRDYTIKWWDHRRYQQVVDYFRGRILFVQVGQHGDPHPPLEGVIDLRGRTDLRQLVRLMHHAQGVLCPVTSLMHLAAAVETRAPYPPWRPCVVVAGGREPPHWEAYPHHQFIHNVGTLPCCADAPCWRSRILPLGDGDRKDRPDDLCLDVVNQLPRCMDQITADEVIRRIRLYFDGGVIRYLTPAESAVAKATLRRLNPKPCTSSGSRRPASELNRAKPGSTRRLPPVTICVLTYGDFPQLARRCLESIRHCCDRRQYHLVVGGNAVSDGTRKYLIRLQESGAIDRLLLSPLNLYKNPMMRRMFADIETEFIWWFDDDSHIVEPGALTRWLRVARRSPASVAAWGHVHFFSHETDFNFGGDIRKFIRESPWFRGKPLPAGALAGRKPGGDGAGETDDPRWFFPTGGCWLARTAAIRALDWPDRRIIFPAEDILFGEAIRQQEWEVRDVGSLGVAINQSATRWQEKRKLMRRQLAGA
jgi:ADP-heptose:LPS heptosyltransferase/GT2 family glycosyltransferase